MSTPGAHVPAVSVVIPAYRAAATVRETLQSLQAQTSSDWEAVVVDDGSDDGTGDVVAALTEQDPRIRLVRSRHGGVSSARNKGIAEARADWLLFLDADDLLEPSALQVLLDATSPDTDLVMGAYSRVTPDGRRLAGELPPAPEDWFPVLAYRCPTTIHACLVRRAVVDAVGRFDTSLVTCEDWDLWLRVVRRGRIVATVPESVAIYRVRPESALQDERHFLADAVTVVQRAHGPDPRVPDAAAAHSRGEPAALARGRLLLLACWAAGQAIGAGRDGAALLELLGDGERPGLDPDWAADNIAAGLEIHGHDRSWDHLGPLLDRFLTALDERSGDPTIAGHVRRRLEAVVLDRAAGPAAVAGSTHGIVIRIGEPIADVLMPAGTDVLRVHVVDDRGAVGAVTLPAFGGEVSRLVIADAVAAEFGWEVLGRFFASTDYPEGTVHDDVGWLTLLRELWGRPDWSETDFYDPDRRDRIGGTATTPVDGWVTVEIGPVLPSIPPMDGDVHLAVAVGGRVIGGMSVSAPRGLTAQQLRVAISTESGMELCVAAVREGLLLGARQSSLRSRLEDAAGRALATNDSAPLLGRHPRGGVSSPASRHASLPLEAVEVLAPIFAAQRQPLTTSGGSDSSVRYGPDLLWSAPPPPSRIGDGGAGHDGSSAGRHEFEALFAASADPWRYDSEYEQTKYAETLELLPAAPVQRALEVGCAAGHFTRLLAPRVQRLVAADISGLALAAAQERCRELGNIDYLRLDLRTEALPGRFDLVVCSEMLYYAADRDDLPQLARRIAAALRPGGHFLTAHAHTLADGGPLPAFDWDNVPFGAAFIGETFGRTPGLEQIRELRTPLYRIQLYRKTGRARRLLSPVSRPRPRVEKRPLSAPLPARVSARVRWDGDQVATWRPAGPVETKALPILMYHRIADHGPEQLSRYRVSPAVFEEQVDYLRSAGFRSVTLEEWAAARRLNTPLPGRAVIITFDDAYVDFAEHAWPVLQRHGFAATMFVPTAHVGRDNAWDACFGPTAPLLDWTGLRDLNEAGVTLGAHGHSHRLLSGLPPCEVAEEAARSRRDMEDRLGVPVTAVAYPYGKHDSLVTHIHGACGFLHGVTTRSGLSSLRDRALELPRVEITRDDGVAGLVSKLGGGDW